MEATRTDDKRFGRPMHRDRPGHEGGGQLFVARRERDFTRGLLSEKGHGNDFLVFQPSVLFVRTLGDGVLRLNDASPTSAARRRITSCFLPATTCGRTTPNSTGASRRCATRCST